MSVYKTPFCFKDIFLILFTFLSIFFVAFNYHSSILHHLTTLSYTIATATADTTTTKNSPTTVNHLVFSIASSSKTFSQRKKFLRLWYKPNFTRTYVFLDHPSSENYNSPENIDLPPFLIYDDMSRFPYTHGLGARYALGLTYMIKQVVARNDSNVRWYIFGDDDTVFIVDNLVKTLQKYDHNEWYYIGSNSESYVQNDYFSFDMAFGGGGYAVSSPLARVLARVLDSCLMRYPSLYSSDARIFSCLAELGVSLTHEPGFHQDDVWGNLFGILASHPLSPLLSLHHIDDVHSLFPKMTKIQALQHFFKAANADPARISQQYICYDRKNSLSIAVAWGYAVQVYEGDITVPELMTVLRSFESYDKNKRSPYFMFKTKVESRGPCQKMVAFLESVDSNGDNVWSNYTRHRVKGKTCKKYGNKIIKNLEEITVFSSKLDIDARQVTAPRRQCCDVSLSSEKSMDIQIRPCGIDELITMSP
ncbi:hypothetical protein P3S67_016150 [Capsicum chacoense]